MKKLIPLLILIGLFCAGCNQKFSVGKAANPSGKFRS